MTFRELLKLSHREYTAYRTRSRTTVITIGAMFGISLAMLFVAQGLENMVLKYAGDATGDGVYLASSFESGEANLISNRIQKFGGEIVNFTSEQKAEISETIPESVLIAKFTNLKNAYEYYQNK